MKVFVTGGTGVLGRSTIPKLVAAGHQVTALARGVDKAAQVRTAGATPVEVDLFDPRAVQDATRGYEGILHLATKIPTMTKAALASTWAENSRIRTEGTRNLVDAALANGARLFVKESIAFLYADGGGAWLDENSPLDAQGLMAPTIDGEAIALEFAGDGRRAVVLRFGIFHAARAAHTEAFLKLARMHVSPTLGDPAGYQPIIHVDDAADAVVAVVDDDRARGVYNVVDEPMTRRDYTRVLGEAMGKKLHMPPRALGRAGGSKADYLTRSQRVSNRRLKEDTSWTPAHPDAAATWRSILAAR
jgi:nucleoside-diphosphate-sugar epimerase